MQGQVLGFNGAFGVIAGDDGQRYEFDLEDWRGDRTPRPGARVDFVGRDGVAWEVYPLNAGAASPLDALSGLGDRLKANGNALEFVASRPQLIVEAAVLLAAVAANFVVMRDNGVSALGLSGALGDAADTVGLFSSGKSVLLGFASYVAMLLWLIVPLAILSIFFELTGKRNRMVELLLAGACLLAVPVYLLAMLAIDRVAQGGLLRWALGLQMGFGGYLLIFGGVLLLLIGLGRIKRIPGL